jgi:hypothetical protein
LALLMHRVLEDSIKRWVLPSKRQRRADEAAST